MAIDPLKNLVLFKLSQGYDDEAVSMVLEEDAGAFFPLPSTEGAFNLIIYNSTDYANPAYQRRAFFLGEEDTDIEIIRVGARSGDTLSSITRGQEGTTAQNHNKEGKEYSVILSFTEKTMSDIKGEFLSKTNTTEYIPTDDYHPATKKYVDATAGGGGASFAYALQSNFTATGGDKVDVPNMSFDVEANKKYYVLFSPRFFLGAGETTISCYVQAPTNSRYSGHYHLLGSTTNTGAWVYTTTVPYLYTQTSGNMFIAHLLIETVNSGAIKLQIEPYPGNTAASGLLASSLLIIKEVG